MDEEDLVPGQDMAVKVTLKNTGNSEEENVYVSSLIADYGQKVNKKIGDLSKGETRTIVLHQTLPDLAPGFHYLRISVWNDRFKREIYREFYLP